jgi:hypothetical protein
MINPEPYINLRTKCQAINTDLTMLEEKCISDMKDVNRSSKYTRQNGDKISIDRDMEADVLEMIGVLKKLDFTAPEIADELNRNGLKTVTGLDFTGQSVYRVWSGVGK